jgi:hypothetical protein
MHRLRRAHVADRSNAVFRSSRARVAARLLSQEMISGHAKEFLIRVLDLVSKISRAPWLTFKKMDRRTFAVHSSTPIWVMLGPQVQ